MTAHRCSGCERNWQATTKYNNCPTCKVPTWVSLYHEPDSTTETPADTSERNHKDFAKFVSQREQELELEFSKIIARSFAPQEIERLKRYADGQADQNRRRLEAVTLAEIEVSKQNGGGHWSY